MLEVKFNILKYLIWKKLKNPLPAKHQAICQRSNAEWLVHATRDLWASRDLVLSFESSLTDNMTLGNNNNIINHNILCLGA